jgi:hypothetical protein
MKCPKCNYVSHDYLDMCRKCGRHLAAFKQEMGLVVHRPGILDLALVLGGARADDIFASVEPEGVMHSSEDDDFDIRLDEYADHPGARHGAHLGSLWASGQTLEEDRAGMEHLTLELDAADLSAEMRTQLRAAQALPETSQPSRPATRPPAEPSGPQPPHHITFTMGPGSMSSELPPGVFQDTAMLAAPHLPFIPETTAPQDMARTVRLDVNGIDVPPSVLPVTPGAPSERTERHDEAVAEHIDAPTSGAALSGAIAFPHMQDVVPAEDMPAVPEAQEPEVDNPTIPTIDLLDVEVAPSEAETRAAPEAEEAVGTSLPTNLPDPTLDEPLLAFLDEEIQFMQPPLELPDMPVEATPEGMLAEADTLAWGDLEEPTLAGHLTLEMDAPDLPDDVISSLFEKTVPPPQPDPATTGARAGFDPAWGFTSSDAQVLGDLDDTTPQGHLTLELNTTEMQQDASSAATDDPLRAHPPGDVPPQTSPPQKPADDEEGLILDLEDLDFDDEKRI